MRVTTILKVLAYLSVLAFIGGIVLVTVYPDDVTYVRMENISLLILLLIGFIQYRRRWHPNPFHKIAYCLYEEMEAFYNDYINARIQEKGKALEAMVATLVVELPRYFDKEAHNKVQMVQDDLTTLGRAMFTGALPWYPEGPSELLARIQDPVLRDALRPLRTIDSICWELTEARIKRDSAVESQRGPCQKIVDLLKAELAILVGALDSAVVPGQLEGARQERSKYEPGTVAYRAADTKVQLLKTVLV